MGAQRLASRLDGFPLALVTAGTFLRKSTMSFDQYFDEYDGKWYFNLGRSLELQEYPDRTLYNTWEMSHSRLQTEDPHAAQALSLLAYFDNK